MSDLDALRHLKSFLVVVEAGNIIRAAETLYISQPCLSGQMKQLQEAVQVRLLVPHRGGVHATPAAEMLIAGSKPILQLCDDLFAAMRSADPEIFAPMRIGFSSFADHALFDMVCATHASLYPACKIKSQIGDNVELLSLLDRGDIDAALLTLPVSAEGLKTYAFTSARLVACMRADDPLSKCKEITPADLGSKLTIFREPKQHPEAHIRLIEMLDEVGITGDVANTHGNPHDLQWTVGSGDGYALIREGSLMHDGLITRPIAGVTWTVDSALILGKSSERTLSRLVTALRKRFNRQSDLPPAKSVRSVRPSLHDKILPLFG
jgi:DNA-binding transcriptional LysR family regulator